MRSAFTIALTCVLIVALLGLLYAQFERPRTISVAVRTEIVSTVFVRTEQWALDNAIWCRASEGARQERRQGNASSQSTLSEVSEVSCGNAEETLATGRMVLELLPGASLEVSRQGLGSIQVKFLTEGSDPAARVTSVAGANTAGFGDRIVLEPASIGALALGQRAVVGQEIKAGVRSLLLEGTVVMREVLWPGGGYVTVRTEKLLSADTVAFVQGSNAQQFDEVNGFLWSTEAGERGFNLTASGSASGLALALTRRGHEVALRRPSWTDRAVNDPIALGLLSLLALATAIVTIIRETSALLRGT